MRKLFLGISAMFLFIAGSWSASGEWPEFDLNSKEPVRANVDDGFGGEWNFLKHPGGNVMVQRAPFSGWGPIFASSGRYYFNDSLEFDEKSLPLSAGLPIAFYGYLTKLNNENIVLYVYLYVNPETGEIDKVLFKYKLYGTNNILHSVPPRNFTLFEDILKKTVKFKPPHGIFDPEKMKEWYGDSRFRDKPEDGIYYVYRVEFPAPAEGEPDFLATTMGKD